MEKQMSCIMGIPGPVHNPSCSSPQVLSSQFEALIFYSCFCGLLLSPLVTTLYFANNGLYKHNTYSITIYDNFKGLVWKI